MSAPAIDPRPRSVRRDLRVRHPSQQDIAKLAYTFWQKRGSREGSSEQDWLEAERRLKGDELSILSRG